MDRLPLPVVLIVFKQLLLQDIIGDAFVTAGILLVRRSDQGLYPVADALPIVGLFPGVLGQESINPLRRLQETGFIVDTSMVRPPANWLRANPDIEQDIGDLVSERCSEHYSQLLLEFPREGAVGS